VKVYFELSSAHVRALERLIDGLRNEEIRNAITVCGTPHVATAASGPRRGVCQRPKIAELSRSRMVEFDTLQ
jgi:hypothetical protein